MVRSQEQVTEKKKREVSPAFALTLKCVREARKAIKEKRLENALAQVEKGLSLLSVGEDSLSRHRAIASTSFVEVRAVRHCLKKAADALKRDNPEAADKALATIQEELFFGLDLAVLSLMKTAPQPPPHEWYEEEPEWKKGNDGTSKPWLG